MRARTSRNPAVQSRSNTTHPQEYSGAALCSNDYFSSPAGETSEPTNRRISPRRPKLDLLDLSGDGLLVENASDDSELSGKILLADPSLRGGIFHKSVVLLAEHSIDDGAMGLILNQPAGHTVGDLLKGNQFSDLRSVQVHIGGPVAKSHLSFAAFWNDQKRFHFEARISAEEAVQYVNRPGAIVRAFVGYSGWEKSQLEGEIEENSWVPIPAKPDLLSNSHDVTLWKSIMEGISPFHYLLSKAPDELLSN